NDKENIYGDIRHGLNNHYNNSNNNYYDNNKYRYNNYGNNNYDENNLKYNKYIGYSNSYYDANKNDNTNTYLNAISQYNNGRHTYDTHKKRLKNQEYYWYNERNYDNQYIYQNKQYKCNLYNTVQQGKSIYGYYNSSWYHNDHGKYNRFKYNRFSN